MAKETLKNLGGSYEKEEKRKTLSSTISKKLIYELQEGHGEYVDRWQDESKLPNKVAYDLIDKGRGDEVYEHIEKFNPTRQLFERLLEVGHIDLEDIKLFKGLNKGTLDKILRYNPDRIIHLEATDFGVDKNTWMRYEIVAEKFLNYDYDVDRVSPGDTFYANIYIRYFSMDEIELEECYKNLYNGI